jgi:hypothetical protein
LGSFPAGSLHLVDVLAGFGNILPLVIFFDSQVEI